MQALHRHSTLGVEVAEMAAHSCINWSQQLVAIGGIGSQAKHENPDLKRDCMLSGTKDNPDGVCQILICIHQSTQF